jgi:hypothetical protein
MSKPSAITSLAAAFMIMGIPATAISAKPTKSAKPIIPAGCPIMNASGWKALVNAQPPAKPRLNVSGLVQVNTGGYKVEFGRKGTDFNPTIVTLELTVMAPPQGTIVTPSLVKIPVSTIVPNVLRKLSKVVINCNGAKLHEIAPVPIVD